MKVFALILSLYSFNSFAALYSGVVKGKNQNCQLKIENTYYDGTEERQNLRINVEISFPDDHHADELEIFQITLQPTPVVNVYSGMALNGQDKLNVGSSSNNEFIPQMFSFRWIHGSHFHNIQCLNLTQSQL